MSSLHAVKESIFADIVKDRFSQLRLYSRLYNKVKILSVGKENLTDGPDFLGAKVQFDDRVECGDIEVHVNSSSWYFHNHHIDSKYKNTILNLCLKDDSEEGYNIYSDDKIVTIAYVDENIYNSLKEEMNKQFIYNKTSAAGGLCAPFNNENNIGKYLQHFGMERFNAKVKKFKNSIQRYGVEQAFYIALLELLGYVHNTEGFTKVANDVPFSYLKKLYTDGIISEVNGVYELYLKAIEKIESSQGSKLWNRKSIFPKSNPLIRLKQISPFIFSLLSVDVKSFLKNMYNLYKDNKIERFLNNIIKSRFIVRSIVFNVILPFFKIYVEEFLNNDIYECKALPTNYLTRLALNRMFYNNKKIRLKKEIHQQGIMYLSKNYCSYGLKGCEWCSLYIEYTA